MGETLGVDNRGSAPGALAFSLPAVRVFLLEDHDLVRKGMREVALRAGFVVVGEAATAADGLIRILASHPQVAILDGRLPDGSGIDVCRDVRAADPSIACLIYSSYLDDDSLTAAVAAGASGYLLKQARGTALVDGVRQVAAGESLFDPYDV